ncbi:MAG: hypothetical protein Q7S57_01770 [bacterium]|nr:hypothetical protein [bacterium]
MINTQGKWVKYDQGTDHIPLVESLQGHGTGWCTAGESTAEAQLKTGDFYVYYSNDQDGNSRIPRVAIRMQEGSIAEVRGIAVEQNLDQYVGDVVKDKLKEFPDGAQYEKKNSDMRKLTDIAKKFVDISNIKNKIAEIEQTREWYKDSFLYLEMEKLNEEFYLMFLENSAVRLSKEELVFLYELDSPIEGFGYQRDPRIEELRSQRNIDEDMPIVFECANAQIARTQAEINENTKAYVGKLEPGIFDKIQQYNIEHIYTTFPEGRIRRTSVEIGGKTKDQLKQESEQAIVNISAYTKSMLDNKDFTTQESMEKINLIRLTVKDLGFKSGATTEEIYQRAFELGLERCPAEVGPNYRLQYLDQPMNERLYIGMKQITDSVGDPGVFGLERNEDGLWLNGPWSEPARGWDPNESFVWIIRNSLGVN